MAEILLHDLKSPLSTIITTGEILRDVARTDFPEWLTMIRNMMTAARREVALLEDMSDFMLLRVDSFPLNLERVPVAEVINRLAEQVEDVLANKEIRLEKEVAPNLAMILADSRLVTRVLITLVDVSLRFCLRGSTLRILAHQQGDRVVIQLSDNGRPIMQDYSDILWQLSDQMRARQAGSRSTVAMGLPFVWEAVRAMGGEIEAISTPEWTTVTLVFLVAPPTGH
ncbi:MAG: hypothetical protein HC915_17585 [Anaerolineae bacterium]|nr:hypothetical protein [Anaerolineae bacterium]